MSLTAPASGAVFQAGATITLSASATPTNSSRPITKVEFFRGGTTLIGTDTSSPYSFSWTSVPAGSYTITAKATDSSGATATSASRTIKVNAPPTVTLTAPANGAFFNPGSTITLTATASDTDGTISKVEFFRGGTTLIGSDTTAPYSFAWTNVAAGSYAVTARATDSNGAVTTSLALAIFVDAAPTVSITSPAGGAAVKAGTLVSITATAADADGTVSTVDFFDGGALIGTATTAPYSVTWLNSFGGFPSPGNHTLTARATDNLGRATTSAPVTVLVDNPPTVSITSPAFGAVFAPPASYTIAATATDSDGTVSKVEFFEGTTLLRTFTAAPYSLSLTGVPAGPHNYVVKATDNNGITGLAGVNVSVGALPSVSITSPADRTVLSAPASFTLTAAASDPDGTIAKVDFSEMCISGPQCINGLMLIGTSTAPPYTLSITGLSGSRTYVATATDNDGLKAQSASVLVIAEALPTVSITSPASGATFIAPANITITATASDSDGTVAKVEFFDGTTLVGTKTAAPYSVALTNVAAGTHSYTARATDNVGGATTSAAVSVTVNAPPTVSITSPANGSVFSAPASFTLVAAASATNATIAKVDFYEFCFTGSDCFCSSPPQECLVNGGQRLIGTSTAPPYSLSLANVALGGHRYIAGATDSNGALGVSATVTVTVNSPPAVSITSPASGATFNAPADITITASASDSDGTVAKVDFYQRTTLLGTSTAAPYSFAWTGVAAGSYSLTAVATDDRGGTTTSAAVTVTVNTPTTVQSLAPATLQLTPGASGALTVGIASAQASDTIVTVASSDPSVATVPSSVVVAAGSTTAPVAVSAVAAGTVQVTASLGQSSAASTVQVVAPPVISGETPRDVTLAGGATPEVAASYSSPGSSIDPASVRLQLDGTDVTAASTVAASGVLYLVTRPLADATHTVSLTVADVLGGTTTRTWAFAVDDPAPNFYNETPRGVSLVDRNPRIRVLLSGFGIVPTSVRISIDGADVTGQADVGIDHIVYTPVTALANGDHTVSVSATDGRGATGSKQWTFTITTPPPPSTNSDGVRTGRTVNPTIRVLP